MERRAEIVYAQYHTVANEEELRKEWERESGCRVSMRREDGRLIYEILEPLPPLMEETTDAQAMSAQHLSINKPTI